MTDIEAIAAVRVVIEKLPLHEQKNVLRYVLHAIDSRVMAEAERAAVAQINEQAKQAIVDERVARRAGSLGRIS